MLTRTSGYLFSVGTTLLLVIVVGGVTVVDLSPSPLPETSLTPLEVGTYYYTLRKLSDADPGRTVGISFSLRETSRLLEAFPPPVSRYGFKLVGAHVDGRGDAARVRGIFRGPVGGYYRVDFVGVVQIKDRRWVVTPQSLKLGWVPLGWMLPGTWRFGGPVRFAGGKLILKQARLDGSGLSARVLTRDLKIDVPDRDQGGFKLGDWLAGE